MIAGRWSIAASTLLAITAAARAGDGATVENAEIVRLEVYPPTVSLTTVRDVQRLIAIAIDEAGLARDVTGELTIEIADPALARRDGAMILPLADGTTTIRVECRGQMREIPLTVTGAGAERPVSFRLDVIPVFTGAGCNTGGCHGSARGQDGFRLSLFGFDPDGDWDRLTHQIAGRRIDLAFPEASLMLRKATGAVPHTGGRRFKDDSAMYETLRRWVAAGVPNDAPGVARVTGIELYPPPPAIVLGGAGRTLPLVVVASYSDGALRDVTDLAVFRTNNDVSVKVSRDGVVSSHEPGEAFITASYDTFTVGSPFIVLADDSTFVAHDPADGGPVPASDLDELVAAKLSKLRINPSPLCTDEQFIRRVYLDVIGLLPPPEAREAFLTDEAPDKRARLVEALLKRREFADLWVMQWAELLQIRSNQQISEKAALLYFEWVRNSIAGNVPIDRMVREILTATGGTFTNPPTNFYQNQADTLVLAENVAQSFMGIRIQCAQCHNHPFDRWTQDDYYGFAAFFPQVGRKRGEDPRETIVFDRRGGEVNHPVGNRVMAPTFLGGETPDLRGRDRREVIAEWLTSKDNPWFARSFANRVWAHFMGVGIVEPVDDFRVSNPAANDPLLDALAAKLTAYDYDFNRLVYDICTSRTYQRSTSINESNAHDERNFSRALVRRLRAETLLDIVCQVTDAPEKLKGLPLGARAVQIADGTTSNYFLTTFGRARRESVCACEVMREPSLSQALHLLNGETVNRKITQGDVVGQLLARAGSPPAALSELYVRCLARAPTEAEQAVLATELEGGADPKIILEDLFWAILNSREFIFNH